MVVRRTEWKKLAAIVAGFAVCFWLPVGAGRFDNAVLEALHLVKWYAREHVLLCLVPAFLIAGAIGVFISQASVMKYLGPRANKVVAYGVASVSGAILAVCSCTVLPLFAGIYRMGAGLGPACAFLYSGPAINVLAIVLTARILGLQLGIARAVGAIVFSVVIGLLMHIIFRKEETEKANGQMGMPEPGGSRPLWQSALTVAGMVAVLVFANWARSGDVRAVFLCCPGGLNTLAVEGALVSADGEQTTVRTDSGETRQIPAAQLVEVTERPAETVYDRVWYSRWWLVAVAGAFVAFGLRRWYSAQERADWVEQSWGFAKQILPLLLMGVLVAGLLLGRVEREGLIPSRWVVAAVGGNSLRANLAASVLAAFMYFATLTEVPILQGLIGAGMGKGPALALLLAGPALSLPNMLVIRSIMGTRRTVVFVLLVVVMATVAGMLYGAFAG